MSSLEVYNNIISWLIRNSLHLKERARHNRNMHTLPSCMEDDVTLVVVLVVMVAVMVAGIGEQPSAPMPLPVLPVLQVQTIFSVMSLHKAF